MAFAHYVKLEPDTHNHQHHQQQHYYFGGGRETSSSPWPSSPPLPDFTTHAAGASRPPSATGFLSSSMNFLANVVADPTSGAAPAELFKLRARDVDTVQSLVSVLAASTTTNAGAQPPDLAGAAGSPPPATPPPPSLSSSLSLTSSSASCPVRPRAPRRSVKGTSGGATSPGVARRHHHPTSPYAWDHQHQHQHHHQPVAHHPHPHQHHHREVYGQQPPAHTGHYHPYLHAPGVVPVAPCHHHHPLQPQFPTPPSAYSHVSGHNFVSTNHQHSGNSDHWPGHLAAHQPHDQYAAAAAAAGRPMFWSSSTGVVTRATTPISRTMSGEDSEISSAGATTTSVAATSAAVAAAATALIRAHATQQLRKRRRSQSAPPPRDQAIFVPSNGRQVRRQCDGVDNSSDYESRAPAMALAATSGAGPSSPYSSPMIVSSPQSCVEHCYGQSATTSSPPTSPTGVASRTSTTKRSDIYGLLN